MITHAHADLTVYGLIRSTAELHGDQPAITAPGRQPLTYAGLIQKIEHVADALRAAGLGGDTRIATCLPNGPATAVLSVALLATASLAPVNPGLRAEELRRYLDKLRAGALVVSAETEAAAGPVADELGIPVLRLTECPKAGSVHVDVRSTEVYAHTVSSGLPGADDVALVLPTSGTTAMPKVVPLTQRGISASARTIAHSLRLQSSDRCLNVMPLFHIHGLVGALLSSLTVGATVSCTPGFVATDFFDWMDEFRPTWYSAVPTMHQSVLAHAGRHQDSVARHELRFVRACSAPLSELTANELITLFDVPVLEAYGMTEAAHQLAITPFPPAERRSGSVGRATGPELAIMDPNGRLLPPGRVGEIVARGGSLTAGYENDPAANAAAFIDGWFHTGDQGYLDADGYLFITGRLKELINRAGEKIAPREIDEVLLSHPSVAQAVAFGVPHPSLGEQVGAAVVLAPGRDVTPGELRAHVAASLADFKVPSVLRIVDEIPKGPTGKPLRRQLAQLLGVEHSTPRASASPSSAGERQMAELWAHVLKISPRVIDPEQTFADLGGDSVLAVRLVAAVADACGAQVSLLDLLEHPTLRQFSAHVQSSRAAETAKRRPAPGRCLVNIQTEGTRRPLFAVHGVFGDVACFADLARALGANQPLYGLQARGLDGAEAPIESVVDMARHYIEEIRSVQAHGPYQLIGYSSGGSVIFEMARQLAAAGETVSLVGVLDHALSASGYERPRFSLDYPGRVAANLVRNTPFWLRRIQQLGAGRAAAAVRTNLDLLRQTVSRPVGDEAAAWAAFKQRASIAFGEYLGRVPEARLRLIETQHRAVRRYRPRLYAGRVVVFRASRQPILCAHAPDMDWGRYVLGGVVVKTLPGTHQTLLDAPYVTELARALAAFLTDAQAPAATYLTAA